MDADLGGVIVNEVPDLVGGDAPELRPGAKRADRRFLVPREDSAEAQAHDVRELRFDAGR
jgi:hypothetical protein